MAGKVIKGGEAAERAGHAGGVVSAAVFEAHQEARALLERAREEAGRLREEAREAGRQEGMAQVAALLARARLEAGAALERQQDDVVALALRVAERLVGAELAQRPERVVDLCARALAEARRARALVLRVHPDAAGVLREREGELLERLGRSVDLVLREDPAVESVGCVVETELGILDARLSTQLELLRELLLPGRPGGGGAP